LKSFNIEITGVYGCWKVMPGFVVLLEVLEKPWNLLLDFKGTWKALKKTNFCWKCLEIMKTPWIFVRMGFNIGLYQSNSGIERRFQNRRFCETCAVACWVKYSLNTQFLLLEYLLEFYVQKPARTMWCCAENNNSLLVQLHQSKSKSC